MGKTQLYIFSSSKIKLWKEDTMILGKIKGKKKAQERKSTSEFFKTLKFEGEIIKV